MTANTRLLERLGEIARARHVGAGGVAAPPTVGTPAVAMEGRGGLESSGSIGPTLLAALDSRPPVPPGDAEFPSAPAALLSRETGDASVSDTSLSLSESFDSVPDSIEAFLPGGEWRDAGGAVFVHERLRSEIEQPRAFWGRLDEPSDDEPLLQALHGLGLERALFLDLETGGLVSSPVFLAGTMHWNGTDFVLRQYFARHYGEEGPLLRAVSEQVAGFEVLITYNGKSYDAPFLRSRALIHRVRLRMPPVHVDLLHPARRRWRERFDDCRLQTLERWVCRRRRVGDVPGDEVPGLYHDFVRSGNAYRLVPVFHHNLLDVITMAEILCALCAPPGPIDEPRRTPGMPPRVE